MLAAASEGAEFADVTSEGIRAGRESAEARPCRWAAEISLST